MKLNILFIAGLIGPNLSGQDFNPVEMVGGLSSPMQMDIARDGSVYIAQKEGQIWLLPAGSSEIQLAGTVTTLDVLEGGLLGLALSPGFESDRHIYLYYSADDPSGEHYEGLYRYQVGSDGLISTQSEQLILKVPDSGENEHSSGGLSFDRQGNLFIGTGDDTYIGATDGFSPMDERPGREPWDAQKSASNTNDLRGAILRITPTEDGGYTIPAGNLFENPSNTQRGEIYIMGCRNPFRLSPDPNSDWLFWGEPGPNSRLDSESRGPRGHDEVNLARSPGNFGWPYFIGPNRAYHRFNYQTEEAGEAFDPGAPMNMSPNNTGDSLLPEAQPALAWFSYTPFSEWPNFSSGPATAGLTGPFIRLKPGLDSEIKLPDSYDSHLIIFDWAKDDILALAIDSQGNAGTLRPIVLGGQLAADGSQTTPIISPIDIKEGPDGALYVLAWGGVGYPTTTGTGKLFRLEYIGEETRTSSKPLKFNEAFRGATKLVSPGLNQIEWIPGAHALEIRKLTGGLVSRVERSHSGKSTQMIFLSNVGVIRQVP